MTKLEARIRNFVSTHKTQIVIGGIAAAVIVIQHQGIKSLNGFLVENELFDEYYYNGEE